MLMRIYARGLRSSLHQIKGWSMFKVNPVDDRWSLNINCILRNELQWNFNQITPVTKCIVKCHLQCVGHCVLVSIYWHPTCPRHPVGRWCAPVKRTTFPSSSPAIGFLLRLLRRRWSNNQEFWRDNIHAHKIPCTKWSKLCDIYVDYDLLLINQVAPMA